MKKGYPNKSKSKFGNKYATKEYRAELKRKRIVTIFSKLDELLVELAEHSDFL